MNRIEQVFADNRAQGKKGFIPYFTAGYPDLPTSRDLVLAAAECGSSIVELGVPFSDPIADGPVIQHSSQVALQNGMSLAGVLELVAELRRQTECPLVLMGYANVFMKYGYQRFVVDAAASGADGVIVPDLPPEEAEELISAARANEFSIIYLVAQTSTKKRIEKIAAAATGFLYYVARLGVTGQTTGVSPILAENIKRLRQYTKLPIGAGFGISSAEEVKTVVEHADAAIMGSALIRMVTEHQGPGSVAKALKPFIRECVEACQNAG